MNLLLAKFLFTSKLVSRPKPHHQSKTTKKQQKNRLKNMVTNAKIK